MNNDDLMTAYISLCTSNSVFPICNFNKAKREIEKTIFCNAILYNDLTIVRGRLVLCLTKDTYLCQNGNIIDKLFVINRTKGFPKCDFHLHKDYEKFTNQEYIFQYNLNLLQDRPFIKYQYYKYINQLEQIRLQGTTIIEMINNLREDFNFYTLQECIDIINNSIFFIVVQKANEYKHNETRFGVCLREPKLEEIFPNQKRTAFSKISTSYSFYNYFKLRKNYNYFYMDMSHQNSFVINTDDSKKEVILDWYRRLSSYVKNYNDEIQECFEFYGII